MWLHRVRPPLLSLRSLHRVVRFPPPSPHRAWSTLRLGRAVRYPTPKCVPTATLREAADKSNIRSDIWERISDGAAEAQSEGASGPRAVGSERGERVVGSGPRAVGRGRWGEDHARWEEGAETGDVTTPQKLHSKIRVHTIKVYIQK